MPPAFITASSLDLGTKGFAYALEQSHLPGLLIAGVLLVLSILSWSVMASKIALMSRASQRNYRFACAFREIRDPLELHEKGLSLPGAPLFAVYRAGSRELAVQLEQSGGGEARPHGSRQPARRNARITLDQMECVRSAMDRCIGEAVLTFENRMNLLATAVSGAPFLGLLGTVWGVMETFSGIASSSSTASIRDMAPGVAAALVTTVIGLLVAIPAMFGYNFLVNRIRTSTLEMHNFASELAALFERQFVDFRGSPAAVSVQNPQQVAPEQEPIYAGQTLFSQSQGPSPYPPVQVQESFASARSARQPLVEEAPPLLHEPPPLLDDPAPLLHEPSPFLQQAAPMDVTAPVPLQVTAPVPIYRPADAAAAPFGRNPAPSQGYHPAGEGLPMGSFSGGGAQEGSLWPPSPSGALPINPIAQPSGYPPRRDQEPGEHELPRDRQPPRSHAPTHRPGNRTS